MNNSLSRRHKLQRIRSAIEAYESAEEFLFNPNRLELMLEMYGMSELISIAAIRWDAENQVFYDKNKFERYDPGYYSLFGAIIKRAIHDYANYRDIYKELKEEGRQLQKDFKFLRRVIK